MGIRRWWSSLGRPLGGEVGWGPLLFRLFGIPVRSGNEGSFHHVVTYTRTFRGALKLLAHMDKLTSRQIVERAKEVVTQSERSVQATLKTDSRERTRRRARGAMRTTNMDHDSLSNLLSSALRPSMQYKAPRRAREFLMFQPRCEPRVDYGGQAKVPRFKTRCKTHASCAEASRVCCIGGGALNTASLMMLI